MNKRQDAWTQDGFVLVSSQEWFTVRLPDGRLLAPTAGAIDGAHTEIETADGPALAWSDPRIALRNLERLRELADELGIGPEFNARAEVVKFVATQSICQVDIHQPVGDEVRS